MKAAVYDGKILSIKEVPKPTITDSQVLIEVKAGGVCGTDLAIARGHLSTPTPLILGHEFSGKIIEVGDRVEKDWINKRVTAEINSNIDHNCYYCRRKMFTQCIARKAIGIDIDGAFADYIAVESYLLHEIPNSISYDDATFIEPLAAAYQTFEIMPLDKDDKIMVIFGLGKLGLLITQVAKAMGLELIVIDGSDKKLGLARKFGADDIINRMKMDNIPEKIKDFTSGLGADIVVDTTGNPDALKDVISSCRTRGKIHIKSTHGLATPINLTEMVVREITLYTSRCGPFEKAIEGLLSGKIQVGELISKKYTLDQISEALEAYEKNRDHVKSLLVF